MSKVCVELLSVKPQGKTYLKSYLSMSNLGEVGLIVYMYYLMFELLTSWEIVYWAGC